MTNWRLSTDRDVEGSRHQCTLFLLRKHHTGIVGVPFNIFFGARKAWHFL